MIAIDSTGASTNLTDEVFLPPVLQDRKPRTMSGSGKNSTSSTSGEGAAELAENVVESEPLASSANLEKVVIPTLPQKPSIRTDDKNADTGSIITMTSDERVQIFVPSPSGGGTPYSTITKMSNQEFQRTTLSSMTNGGPSSPRLPYTSISWNEFTPKSSRSNLPPKSSSTGLSGGFALEQEDQSIPPFSRRVTSSPTEAHRSLTPLNMDCSETSSPSKHPGSPTVDLRNITDVEMVKISFRSSKSTEKTECASVVASNDNTIRDSDLPSLPIDELKAEESAPLSLSDIQLIDEEDTRS